MNTWWTFNGLDDTEDEDSIYSSSTTGYYGGSYFGRKYRSSLGWSKNKLTDTTYYSNKSWYEGSYGTGEKITDTVKKQILLMTRAYKEVRGMIVILDFPYNVIIKLNNYYSSSSHMYSSGGRTRETRTIYVPSDIMNYSEYTDDEKISIICGLGIHEASHLKYTEYRTYRNYMKGASLTNKFFVNLLEDIRIEDKLLSERPGYLSFIEDSIKFRYLKLKTEIEKLSIPVEDEEVKYIIFNVINFIRFPDKIDSDVIKKYGKLFKEIKSVLSEYHLFTKDSCIIGEKLVNTLASTLEELKYDFSKVDNLIKLLCPDNSFEIRCGFDRSSEAGLCDSEMAKFLSKNPLSGVYTDLISGELELGEGDMTYMKKPIGCDYAYLKVKKRISKYIPSIKKLITGTDKNYEFSIHGCREGALDTNKLAEAYQGVPQVYIKKGKVSTNKTTVCVLIDQSGSMSGLKEQLAIESSILLNESLKDIPGVDLYIYGHSADEKQTGDTILYIYREGDKYCPKYSLSDATAHSNNRDGTAILETAKRVRKYTQDKCIMFVLSDGSPAAHYYCGWSAVQDVKNKVNTVEKMGFTVIQVSIDYVNYAKEMFENVISLELDLANLPKRLSQIIKKSIVKDKQTTVS